MSAFTLVTNAATGAFTATDIRKALELLNHIVAVLGPGGDAGGFGYNSNRLIKSPPTFHNLITIHESQVEGLTKHTCRRALGQGNPHAQNRKCYSPGQL